jgi:drug/metabolite transporter (DMT)-like permease
MTPRTRCLLQLHGAVLLFGLAGPLGKLLTVSPIVIVFGRAALAAVALLLVSVLGKLPLWPRSGRGLLVFIGLGILLACHWVAFFQSVQTSSVALAQITFLTFPVFVALLEPLFFREKLHGRDLLLAAVALVGVAVLVPSLALNDAVTKGVLWGAASGLTFAVLSLLNRKFVRAHSSITIALYQDGFAALTLLPLVMARPPSWNVGDVLLLVVLGIVCTAVAHSLFIAGLHAVRARTASMIVCLEPVYGALLAVVIVGEIPTVRTLLGGLVILAVALCATVHATRGGESSNGPEPPAARPSRGR